MPRQWNKKADWVCATIWSPTLKGEVEASSGDANSP